MMEGGEICFFAVNAGTFNYDLKITIRIYPDACNNQQSEK